MSKSSLPYSLKDVNYDNAKFRQLSFVKVISQSLVTSNLKHDCVSCSIGKFLMLLMISGLAYLTSSANLFSDGLAKGTMAGEDGKIITNGTNRLGNFWWKPPRLPPRLPPDKKVINKKSIHESENINTDLKWKERQEKVKEAFIHAWYGYKKYAMGYDELMPLKKRGVDGLGGLGATIVDALDTAMIMGADEVVSEAGSWVETHLSDRISKKGQVNLFETTIRVLGGLLSAYHLSGGAQGSDSIHKGPKPIVFLETARKLADRLLLAFTSSPTPIPFSDVILHEPSAHRAPGGSSTSEVSTLQLEFNYPSTVSGDPKYRIEAMKVLAHMKNLPKVEGLVPIYLSSEAWKRPVASVSAYRKRHRHRHRQTREWDVSGQCPKFSQIGDAFL